MQNHFSKRDRHWAACQFCLKKGLDQGLQPAVLIPQPLRMAVDFPQWDDIKNWVGKRTRWVNLSNLSALAAIIGVIIATFFAWRTVVLTIKYGESKDQINRLDTLAHRQQSEIDTLVDILRAMRTQNEYAQAQTYELKAQGKNIFDQTHDVAQQLKISQQEQQLSNQLKLIGNKADRNTLRNAFYSISEASNVFHEQGGYDPFDDPEALSDFLDKLQNLVNGQLTNPYLLQDDTLQIQWIKFESQIANCKRIVNLGPNDAVLTIGDDKKPIPADEKGKQTFKLQWMKIFQQQFDVFYAATSMKLMRDKELLYQKEVRPRK